MSRLERETMIPIAVVPDLFDRLCGLTPGDVLSWATDGFLGGHLEMVERSGEAWTSLEAIERFERECSDRIAAQEQGVEYVGS